MKRIILYSLLVVLIIIVTVFSYQSKIDRDNYKRNYQIEASNFDIFKKTINESLSKRILSDFQTMAPDYCYKYGKQNIDSVSTSLLSNRIILIIPELSCNACYDDVYDFIHYASDSLNIKIPILTTKNRYREITNILSEYQIRTDLYYIRIDYFWINDHDEIKFAPYFVFLNQNKVGYHIFIPQPNHMYLTKTYLITMQQRYDSIFR